MTEAYPAHPPDDESRTRASESARLRGELTRAEARAERAERALERIERGAKYTVGSLLVEAAKSPRRLLLLPRDLWRVWRLRKSRRGVAPPPAKQRTRRDDLLDLEAARLLLPRLSARPGAAMSIAGALTDATLLAWERYAAVTRVLPHDAAELALATDPDVVIIESAAALPGQQWAHLGSPAAADRQKAAMRLIDAARAQGRPVVFLRTTPHAHTALLGALEAECDLVLDGPGARRYQTWHPGIDLEGWLNQPMADSPAAAVLDPASDRDALTGPGLSPSERSLAQALAQALRARGIECVAPDPRLSLADGRRDTLRRASFGVASPLRTATNVVGAAGSTLGMLATGRRVMGTSDRDVERILNGAQQAYVTVDAQPIGDAIELAALPQDDTLRRQVLRALLLDASSPVQLQALAHLLGLRSRPIAAWDVSLICDDPDIDAILLQAWRPREVILHTQPADRARDALVDHGIRVVVTPSPTPRTRESLSTAAGCPFVATQADLSDPYSLADILIEEIAGLPARPRPTDAALWRRA